jgi:hypothetical protein
LLAHGFGVDVADGEAFGVRCCRGLAVEVLPVDAGTACSANEMAAELGWLAAGTPVPAGPALPVPFADVVVPGFGVLGLGDGVGVGVGVPLGDTDAVGQLINLADGEVAGGDE